MKKLLLSALVTVSMVSTSLAVWDAPARQVSVFNPGYVNIGQEISGGAPTNSLQAYLNWIDSNWMSTNGFATMAWVQAQGYLTNSAASSNTLAQVLAAGNNALSQNAVGFARIQAVTGSFDVVDIGTANIGTANIATQNITGTFLNSSNDMAVSFMGYPKITISPSGFTSSSDGGTVFTNVVYTLDGNNATKSYPQDQCGSGNNHYYQYDLGTNYCGYYVIKYFFYNNASVSGGFSWGHSYNPSVIMLEAGVAFGDNGGETNTVLVPFSGRYIHLTTTASSTGATVMELYELSVYGTTNGYRNMGGF
jgi:hypothetical protein